MSPGTEFFNRMVSELEATAEHVEDLDALDEHLEDFLDFGSPLDVAERDPDLHEFLRLTRAGEPVPLDITTRLATLGYDVEALEASAESSWVSSST